jgi:hypothetical protein
MIRPAAFGFNQETAVSNAFQTNISPKDSTEVSRIAQDEFDAFADELRKAGINVTVVQDTPDPPKPDAVFPNNWFSTHVLNNGEKILLLYPMLSELRKLEIRKDVVDSLCGKFGYSRSDLTSDRRILEGTGSVVFDHILKRAYAALSPRTDETLLREVCSKLGYEPIVFIATDINGRQVYHTNVVLTIGETFAVICSDMIRDEEQRQSVISRLSESGREVIFISEEQVNCFAGNMIQLRSKNNDKVLVMSDKAYGCLEKEQLEKLLKHNSRIVSAKIKTIETIGGGSARCMIAEIFHQ